MNVHWPGRYNYLRTKLNKDDAIDKLVKEVADAAREDEAKKWESQLKSEQERAGKLMEALVEVQAGSLTGQLTRPDMNKVASKAINEYNNKP